MRVLSCILLAVLLVTALAPSAALTFAVTQKGEAAVGILDVCRQANPAISASGLMPFINECPCSPAPSLFITYADGLTPLLLRDFFPSRYDRPPQA